MLCGATGGRRLPGFGLAGFRGSVLARFRSPGSGSLRAASVVPGVLPPSIRARGGTLSVGPDGAGCDVASVVRAASGVRVASVALCGPVGPVQVRGASPIRFGRFPLLRSGPGNLSMDISAPSVRARDGTLSVGPDGLGCDVASVVRAAWGSGGFGCALRVRRAGAGLRGAPIRFGRFPLLRSGPGNHWPSVLSPSVRARDGTLSVGSGGSGCAGGPACSDGSGCLSGFLSAGHPALFSSGPRLGETGGFSLLRAARPALRGLSLDKSSEKARTGLNYS